MNAVPIFTLKPDITMILASASPRRKELLDSWGLAYQIIPPTLNEPKPTIGEDPRAYTLRLAKAKADNCQKNLKVATNSHYLIIAADTVVSFKETILGKPKDPKDALSMLDLLNGQKHLVTTSVHLIFPPNLPEKSLAFTETSFVYFHKFSKDILESYIATEEPLDKAGSYAIQGRGAFLVEKIEGSWSTVVGLPICQLTHELLARGFLKSRHPLC